MKKGTFLFLSVLTCCLFIFTMTTGAAAWDLSIQCHRGEAGPQFEKITGIKVIVSSI